MNEELQRIWADSRKTVLLVTHSHPGSGLSRRPRGGDDAAAGPHRRCHRRRPAPAAHARDAQYAGVRPLRRRASAAISIPRRKLSTHDRDLLRTSLWRRIANAVAAPLATFCVFVGGWEALAVGLRVFPRSCCRRHRRSRSRSWSGLLHGRFRLAFRRHHVRDSRWLPGRLDGRPRCSASRSALSPFAERIFYPYVVAFQTVPKVAIAPIIVIWFGYGVASKIVITATIAFFPLLANTDRRPARGAARCGMEVLELRVALEPERLREAHDGRARRVGPARELLGGLEGHLVEVVDDVLGDVLLRAARTRRSAPGCRSRGSVGPLRWAAGRSSSRIASSARGVFDAPARRSSRPRPHPAATRRRHRPLNATRPARGRARLRALSDSALRARLRGPGLGGYVCAESGPSRFTHFVARAGEPAKHNLTSVSHRRVRPCSATLSSWIRRWRWSPVPRSGPPEVGDVAAVESSSSRAPAG